MHAARILIVEDDADLADAVALELSHEGYDVRVAGDGPAALRAQLAWDPELVLLDLGLPSIDGLEICAQLREASNAAIMVISARDAVHQRVGGLDAGADDYLVKPFSLQELHARMRALLRRTRMLDAARRLQIGDVVLDAAARTVTRGELPVELTRREFDLLEYLLRNRGQVLERTRILEAVWGTDFLGGSNVIDVYVGYLRRKLAAPGAPEVIETIRGVGYAVRRTP
jgi:two-component system, OmpR family, response regulator MprA